MKAVIGTTIAVVLLLAASIVSARDWPTRPVRILVGSAPGGMADSVAHAIADQLGPMLKQPVFVENKPGRWNTLAAEATAKSTNGHTLELGIGAAHTIVPHLLPLGYNGNRDLVPVVFVGDIPNVLVVSNGLHIDSLQKLIELARQRPDQLGYASSGSGSVQHIAAEILQDVKGLSIRQSPCRGSGTALSGLAEGQVQMRFDTMPAVLEQIRNGTIRALAVTASQRSSLLPDVPTVAEAGAPDLEISAWYGIYMPASTPKSVQDTVHDTISTVLKTPELIGRLRAIGAEITPMTQLQFMAFHAARYQRYGNIIRKNHTRLD
ncbi:Bug family tripartite tricarboxylate transporter substrate binding protein [Cupriavidus sp. CuC1]|uniref:Bug family tripartite tricarboxylate transporter substrate binding protein n=1 Tax=Cupriavidus sp. CuC1 TaxID=3373131 RepID=UPI0037D69EAB